MELKHFSELASMRVPCGYWDRKMAIGNGNFYYAKF